MEVPTLWADVAGADEPPMAGVALEPPPHDAVASVIEIAPTIAQTVRFEWVMMNFSHISNEDFRLQSWPQPAWGSSND